MTYPSKDNSLSYLSQAIELAKQSPPKPSNFRVGCVIVSFEDHLNPHILSTGFTLELAGNTHAEQCALLKLAQNNSIAEDDVGKVLSAAHNTVLYTSLEPCGKRLSGNLPCVQRIISTRKSNLEGGIRKVVFGAKEPGTFVQDSQSCKLLTEAGIEWEYLPELQEEILKVAMEGHEQQSKEGTKKEVARPVQSQEDASRAQSERKAVDQQELRGTAAEEAAPRNRKKRMFEAPPGSEEPTS